VLHKGSNAFRLATTGQLERREPGATSYMVASQAPSAASIHKERDYVSQDAIPAVLPLMADHCRHHERGIRYCCATAGTNADSIIGVARYSASDQKIRAACYARLGKGLSSGVSRGFEFRRRHRVGKGLTSIRRSATRRGAERRRTLHETFLPDRRSIDVRLKEPLAARGPRRPRPW
jgi:hypothetical protein